MYFLIYVKIDIYFFIYIYIHKGLLISMCLPAFYSFVQGVVFSFLYLAL